MNGTPFPNYRISTKRICSDSLLSSNLDSPAIHLAIHADDANSNEIEIKYYELLHVVSDRVCLHKMGLNYARYERI